MSCAQRRFDRWRPATFDNVVVEELSAGWASTDIGAVGVAGSMNQAGGTLTVTGSGSTIWGSSDEFHYAYRALTGDGQIVARVATIEPVHAGTKAGVMLRETLTAGSRHALMSVSVGHGLEFIRRTATGGSSTETSGGSGTAPRWVRLTRTGDTVTAESSTNGTSWTLVGTDTIPMATTIYVGLAVTSHDNTTTATATFDNVVVP